MSDLRISETGDLILGPPLTDTTNGEVLLNNHDKPFRLLSLANERIQMEQMIRARIMTEKGDWIAYPGLGNSLSDLIGEPNTQETALKGKQYIIDCLTYDSFLSADKFTVQTIPVNDKEILYVLNITSKLSQPYTIYVTLNLLEGASIQ